VRPHLGCGRFPIKRIVGESLLVSADIIKEGHDVVVAEARWGLEAGGPRRSAPMALSAERDEWQALIGLDEVGAVEYTVAAWTDHFASWLRELTRKAEAGRDVASELLEGAQLVRAAAARVGGDDAAMLEAYARRIGGDSPQPERVGAALGPDLGALMAAHGARDDLTESAPLRVVVGRERARFGAWYEFFPRSLGRAPGVHGTLADAERRLPAVRALGFDVVYLPPIHPIGRTNRKGRNNALVAAPGDPGSPWAIGNEAGGHDAVNPELGALEDFDHFVNAARAVGLEVALDFAIQCSPDHPYVRRRPEWFRRRPDGTIKYAENPPKRYEDIVAIDMWCEDYVPLWKELERVVRFWIAHGVEIFRVDNPHTKPVAFWEWLIGEIRRDHPGVIFLSEAFTRPKMMQLLAKVGFTQSYTYFTWRNGRAELEEYLLELTRTPMREYFRPNFFVNTPDILHEYLQLGGRPAFKVRLALAATLSPTYGVYSGFELIERTPVRPGSEEYLDSEKYELRARDWDAPGNLNGYIQRVNAIRAANRALQLYTNLSFHDADNPHIISYSKVSEDGTNRILVVANLDPHNTQEATVRLDGAALGVGPDSHFAVHDLLTERRWVWNGAANYVRLDPHDEPVHVFRLEPL
jgi:starch synthase (maltosyl-transferring)